MADTPQVVAPRTGATRAPAAADVPTSVWVDPTTGQPVPIDEQGRSGVPSPWGGLSTDWQPAGGNNASDIYVNSKTGEVVEIGKGDAYGPGTNGQVVKRYTSDEWKAATEQGGNGVLSGASIKNGLRDLVNNLPSDPAGTPGWNGSDNPVDILDAGKNTLDKNGLGINPDGTISGLGGLGGGGGGTAASSANIEAAIAQQNAIAAKMGGAYDNFQGVASPTIATPQAIQAANAAQLDPIQAQLAQAQAAQAAQIGQTALTPQQEAIQAQQVQAAQIAANQQAQSGLIGATRVGPVTNANAATIDPAQQAQIREAQQGLIGGLQGTIAGTDPSVAAIMLRNATDRNVANQYALAQAANGMNTGFAQRTAMINSAEMNQQAIMQQALLRAQEIATARGQLGGVLDSTRGSDIGLATNQAGLQQQTALANAGAANTSTLTQAQINAQRAQEQAKLAAATSQFNAGQANQTNTTQAQLQQAAALANQGASLQAGTTNATLSQQANLANAAALNQTGQTNAQLENAAALQNAQLATQASVANANNVTGANTSSAQLANAVNLANANNQSQANVVTGQLGAQTGIANANNEVSTNALNQKAQQDLAANQLAAAGQAGQTSIGQGNVEAAKAEAEAKKQAALIAGISAGAAALISDPRTKTDIRPVEAELAEFTEKLKPSTWRYREPEKPGRAPGQRFGIMTTDLKKSAIGRSLVRKLEDGTEAVDVPQSVGAILATLSAMNKRLGRVEAR